MIQYKFYGKNVNDGKYADYVYIGSITTADKSIQALIEHAESIGGPINGPLIAITEITAPIRVLKV